MDKLDQRIEDLKEDILCVRRDLSDVIDKMLHFVPDTEYRMHKFKDYLNQMNSCIVGDFVFEPAQVLEQMNREAFKEMFREFKVDEDDLLDDNEAFISLQNDRDSLEDSLEELRAERDKLIEEEKQNGPDN
jgi:vacuolar-type H+-ATPase subunit I/STV1